MTASNTKKISPKTILEMFKALDKALDKKDFSSVQPATKAMLSAKLAALSMKEI